MWSYQHQRFCVHQIPALNDNYIYLIEAKDSDILAVVDPADANAVNQACKILNKPLTHILNTHHHWDHTDGNKALKQHWNCQVVGAASDAERIPAIDIQVSELHPPLLEGLDVQVLEVSGHTIGHIAYVLDDALFCGDTLFGAGCGRIFEGTHEQMWKSLQKLAALPDATQVYCAHEYTLPNLRFARDVDADNLTLQERIHSDTQKRMQKLPTIPSTIGLEKASNPFLMPLQTAFTNHYANAHDINATALDVFTHLRLSKDRW
jgi:hydroxyacylglutathione hydrolase